MLADYGCSEGRNSLLPIGAAVDALRAQHGNDLQVLVLHTDLPGNDYSSLFGTLAHDPLTYQRPGGFPVAVDRSYFEQLTPTGTVALGWSSIALHWLSGQPGLLTGIRPPGSDVRAGCLAGARGRGLRGVPVRARSRVNENADLAAGYGRVLVLAPFGGRSRVPLERGTYLATQADELRARGSRVETIFPEGDSRDIFGVGGNVMDLSTRPVVPRAGYNQVRALAHDLTEFWR